MEYLGPRAILLLVFVAAVLAGCGGEVDLPHVGAFYGDGEELVELPQSSQYPFAVSPSDPQLDTVEGIYVQYPIPSLKDLVLQKVPGNEEIATTIDSNGERIVEIQPRSPLTDGDYCLVVGDQTKTPEELTRWCFSVGGRAIPEASELPDKPQEPTGQVDAQPGLILHAVWAADGDSLAPRLVVRDIEGELVGQIDLPGSPSPQSGDLLGSNLVLTTESRWLWLDTSSFTAKVLEIPSEGVKNLMLDSPRSISSVPERHVILFGESTLPEVIMVSTEDEGVGKSREQREETTELTFSLPFDYAYSGFPQELSVRFEAQYATKAPYMLMRWLTPDGREIRLRSGIVEGSSMHYLIWLDSALQHRLGVSPEIGLFANPNSDPNDPVALQGTYTLEIRAVLFEEDADLGAELVVDFQVDSPLGKVAYLVDLETGKVLNLVANDAETRGIFQGTFSIDEEYLAIATDRGVWLQGTDHPERARLLTDQVPMSTSFSSDGKQIVYVQRSADGSFEAVVGEVDGSDSKVVATGEWLGSAAFVPGQQKLILVRESALSLLLLGNGEERELLEISPRYFTWFAPSGHMLLVGAPDGRGWHILDLEEGTSRSLDDLNGFSEYFGEPHLRWLFFRDRPAGYVAGVRVAALDLETGEVVQIQGLDGGTLFGAVTSASSDADRVVMEGRVPNGEGETEYWLIMAEEGEARLLARGNLSSPNLSSDGRWFVYSQWHQDPETGEIILLDIDSGETRSLGEGIWPVWVRP